MQSRLWFVLAALLGIAATGLETAARTNARPFDHRRHESVSCRTCHGTGDQHRASFIRTPRDCAACHHARERASACRDCHSQDQLGSVEAAFTALTLSVWDTARVRRLPFAHRMHERVACGTCHATPVTLARSRECASCHEQHHRAEAECSSCHQKPPQAAHPRSAHLTCGAAACHAERVAPAADASRNLCVLCHEDRRAHESGGACAGCHKIPDGQTGAAARGDS